MDLIIPQGHGEWFCYPAVKDWPGKIKENQSRMAHWPLEILGEPFPEFRQKVRRRAIQLAQEYTQLDQVPGDPSQILLTGHQPLFYYPGVWFKNFLLAQLARQEGAVALNISVDSDAFAEVGAEIPYYEEGLKKRPVILLHSGPAQPLETYPLPLMEEWQEFRTRIEELLYTLPAKAPRANFTFFTKIAEELLPQSLDFTRFMIYARRLYEGGTGSPHPFYLELPISRLCQTPEFSRFFLSLALDLPRLAQIYNQKLDDYRRVHRFRYPANPFPNLGQKGERWEAPFWIIGEDGARRDLWIEKKGEKLIFLEPGTGPGGEDRNIGEVEVEAGSVRAIHELPLLTKQSRIRPKALLLTLFCRLFLGDFFLHGTGGGKYDRITDEIIKDYYQINPPHFAVATLTLHLPLGLEPWDDEEFGRLEKLVARLGYNPDHCFEELKLAADKEKTLRPLALKKHELIHQMRAANQDKKLLAREIESINTQLKEALAGEIKEVLERWERLKTLREESKIAGYREFPYFLFAAEDLETMAQRAFI
jgi:hypothetical protein